MRANTISSKLSKKAESNPATQEAFCGYYDPGHKKRSINQSIQIACLVIEQRSDSKKPIGLIIPATKEPIEDPSWKELSNLK